MSDRDKLADIISHVIIGGTSGDIADAILTEFLPDVIERACADAWDDGASACWDGNDMQYPNPYRSGS